MINCAHPTHFESALLAGEPWIKRLRGIRANASMRSHAELETMTSLDVGDTAELACQYADLRRKFRHFNVLGDCCGTDFRHVEEICFACEPAA